MLPRFTPCSYPIDDLQLLEELRQAAAEAGGSPPTSLAPASLVLILFC